jgi:hypothetical protein
VIDNGVFNGTNYTTLEEVDTFSSLMEKIIHNGSLPA